MPFDEGRAPEQRRREGEVVQAAIDVFSAKGYKAATIQDVADRVGMLKGSLYYYIDSKEHLLVKIYERINESAAGILRTSAALDLPALERLHHFVRTYLEFIFDNHELMTLYAGEWTQLTGAYRVGVLAQRAEFEEVTRALVRAAQAEGSVPADLDDRHAAYFLLSAVNAVTSWYRPAGQDAPEVIAASYARMTASLLSGVGVPVSPSA